jgi:hypothetical protein
MGYVIEFKCVKCSLTIMKENLTPIMDYLNGQAGSGLVTLPNGIKYGGSNYLLNDLAFDEDEDEVCLSAQAFEMFGVAKNGHYHFDRMYSESKSTVEETIDEIKKIFVYYNGTLEGYFEGEDGATWGHFKIVDGEEQATEGEEKHSLPLRIVKDFKDVQMDLMIAFTTKLFSPSVRIDGYSQHIQTKEGNVDIPIVARKDEVKIYILLQPDKWNKTKTNELKSILSKLRTTEIHHNILLISGHTPPDDVLKAIIDYNEHIPNIFPGAYEAFDASQIMKEKTKILSDKFLVPTDYKSISSKEFKTYITQHLSSIPDSDYLSLIQIGCLLNSNEHVKRGLEQHKEAFKQMKGEERGDSVQKIVEQYTNSNNNTIREYIIFNIDSWIKKKCVYAAMSSLVAHGIIYNDNELIELETKGILNIKTHSGQNQLYRFVVKELFDKNHFDEGILYLEKFFESIWKIDDDDDLDRLFALGICSFWDYQNPKVISYLTEKLNYYLTECKVNPLFTNMIFVKAIEHKQWDIAQKLMTSQMKFVQSIKIKDIKDIEIFELNSWKIAQNAFHLNQTSVALEWAKVALMATKKNPAGTIHFGACAGAFLFELAKRNMQKELDKFIKQFQKIKPSRYDVQYRKKMESQVEELKIQIILALCQLPKRDRMKEVQQCIQALDDKEIYNFTVNRLWNHPGPLTHELLAIIESEFYRRGLNEKNSTYLSTLNVMLFSKTHDPYLLIKAENYGPIISLHSWGFSSQAKTLIEAYLKINDIQNMIRIAESAYLFLHNAKITDFDDRGSYIKAFVDYYNKTNDIHFLNYAVLLFNEIKKWEHKSDFSFPLIQAILNYYGKLPQNE